MTEVLPALIKALAVELDWREMCPVRHKLIKFAQNDKVNTVHLSIWE
jgi:hypothetical protein